MEKDQSNNLRVIQATIEGQTAQICLKLLTNQISIDVTRGDSVYNMRNSYEDMLLQKEAGPWQLTCTSLEELFNVVTHILDKEQSRTFFRMDEDILTIEFILLNVVGSEFKVRLALEKKKEKIQMDSIAQDTSSEMINTLIMKIQSNEQELLQQQKNFQEFKVKTEEKESQQRAIIEKLQADASKREANKVRIDSLFQVTSELRKNVNLSKSFRVLNMKEGLKELSDNFGIFKTSQKAELNNFIKFINLRLTDLEQKLFTVQLNIKEVKSQLPIGKKLNNARKQQTISFGDLKLLAPDFDQNGSKIMTPQFVSFITEGHFNDINWPEDFKLIYSAKRDGSQAQQFWKLVDGKGNAFIFVKSTEGKSFGGYRSVKFEKRINGWHEDKTAYLFQLDQQFKSEIRPGKEGKAVYDYGGYLPYFGSGADMYIDPNCVNNSESYSYFGHTYQKPKNCKNPKEFLAGSWKFKVEELEIYQIKE